MTQICRDLFGRINLTKMTNKNLDNRIAYFTKMLSGNVKDKEYMGDRISDHEIKEYVKELKEEKRKR